MVKVLIRVFCCLCFANEAMGQGQSVTSLGYIDSIEIGIKKGTYKKIQAKMNCFELWQRLYVDASGKVVKAIGGIPQDCYQMEKVLYLKHDSMVYYIENYNPFKGDPSCKGLVPQSFGYEAKEGRLLMIDLNKKVPVEAEEAEATLQSIKGLYRAVYRDLNSICYRSPSAAEKHVLDVNSKIIGGEIKMERITDSDDSLGTVIAYKHKGELVLLKTKYTKHSVAKSYNLYFLKGELIDYSYDEEELNDSLNQIKYADRFKIVDGHIKNFDLLEIINPKYIKRQEADIVKELLYFAKNLRQKYKL